MARKISLKYIEEEKQEFVDNYILDYQLDDANYRNTIIEFLEDKKEFYEEYREELELLGINLDSSEVAEKALGKYEVISKEDEKSKLIVKYSDGMKHDRTRFLTYSDYDTENIKTIIVTNPVDVDYEIELFNEGLIDNLIIALLCFKRDNKFQEKVKKFEQFSVAVPYNFEGVAATTDKGHIYINKYSRK